MPTQYTYFISVSAILNVNYQYAYDVYLQQKFIKPLCIAYPY